jgi:hypothetical protein
MDTMIARCGVMKVARADEAAEVASTRDVQVVLPGERGAADSILILLDRGFFEEKARSALGAAPRARQECYSAPDPVIRELGRSLRAELRDSGIPSTEYLESLASVIAVYVAGMTTREIA